MIPTIYTLQNNRCCQRRRQTVIFFSSKYPALRRDVCLSLCARKIHCNFTPDFAWKPIKLLVFLMKEELIKNTGPCKSVGACQKLLCEHFSRAFSTVVKLDEEGDSTRTFSETFMINPNYFGVTLISLLVLHLHICSSKKRQYYNYCLYSDRFSPKNVQRSLWQISILCSQADSIQILWNFSFSCLLRSQIVTYYLSTCKV